MGIDDGRRKAQGARLAKARKAAGYRSAREAALSNGWNEGTYRAHEGGWRTIGLDDAERYARRYRAKGVDVSAQQVLFGEGEGDYAAPPQEQDDVPIMGYVGAGAEIEPVFEQPPPDGYAQARLPPDFSLRGDFVAFMVDGESMFPEHDPGDVIICRREQRLSIDSYLNQKAIVRTADGRRYLKRITMGSRRGLYNLESWNAMTIRDAQIEWVGEIVTEIPTNQARVVYRLEREDESERRRLPGKPA